MAGPRIARGGRRADRRHPGGVALAALLTLSGAVGAEPARADGPPLEARTRDPEGWWKGRVIVDADVLAAGGLAAVQGRLASWKGVGAVRIAPMKHDATGAIEDHTAFDARAGDAEAFARFVVAAHAADIAVLVAFEMNDVARSHPWFVAAESGDRLAQDCFRWSDAPVEGQAERWSESALGGRWYFHARGPERPDLDLGHRLTRARVERGAATWLERGADGVLLGSVRMLFEDERGARDRPQSVALVRDLARTLGADGALIAIEVDGSALLYLDATVLAIDGEGSQALAGAAVASSAFAVADRALPSGATLGVRASDARAAVRALLSHSSVVLTDALLADASVRAALAARVAHGALRTGLRWPLSEVNAASWSWARGASGQRVVVVDNGGAAPLSVQLDARTLAAGEVELLSVVGGVEASWRHGRVVATVPPATTAAWLLKIATAPTSYIFGRPGMTGARAGTAIDRGLLSVDRPGVGFDRDVERSLSCTRGRGRDAGYVACSVPLPRDGLRWHLDLPPGPYEVEVELLGKARVTAEGQLLAPVPRKRAVGGAVFVRDGRLMLDASGEGGALSEVRVRPARFRAEAPKMDVRTDRLVLRAPGPGVVEWRMNGSRAEPTELAQLVRRGAQWEATLGPWPKGAVTEIAWVIRGAEGTFLTAEGGAEVLVAIP